MPLPQELVDAIVDWVSFDRSMLRALGLTHSSFGPRTRMHLFRAIYVKYNTSTRTFLDLVSSSSMGYLIASSVRCLTIVGLKTKIEWDQQDHDIPIIVQKLVNLHDLVFLKTFSATLHLVTGAFPFLDPTTSLTRYGPIIYATILRHLKSSIQH